MPERFCLEIKDEFVVDLTCAVCAAPSLRVNHLPDYVDYVSCDACGSAFVIEEEGERVVYGEISEQYSDTAKVVLKNWVTLGVVSRLASAERERKGIALPDVLGPLTDDFQAAERIDEDVGVSSESPSQMAPEAGIPLVQKVDAVPSPGPRTQAVPPFVGDQAETAEALPEERYRVRIKGESIYFPLKACAHCMKTPATGRLAISGSLPEGEDPDRRRRAVFGLPLCDDCRRKSNALSGAQRTARLQAHLTAMLVGLALVVVALGLGVVDFNRGIGFGLLMLGIIASVGYVLPLGLLLPRTKNAPPLVDAQLIKTTLRVQPPEKRAAETLFEFRNEDYAQLFLKSNPISAVTPVEKLIIQPDIPVPED